MRSTRRRRRRRGREKMTEVIESSREVRRVLNERFCAPDRLM